MAALTPLLSTTTEGALLEIVEHLSELPAVSAKGATPKAMIDTYTIDGVTGKVSIAVTMYASATPNTNGKPVLTAVEVF